MVLERESRLERMKACLRTAFDPEMLHVVDDSAQHAGHAGASMAGETHYSITMISARFVGQSRVVRSRAVHEVLASEFQTGLHALTLSLRAPTDAAQPRRLKNL